jgi:hypothetical protein
MVENSVSSVAENASHLPSGDQEYSPAASGRRPAITVRVLAVPAGLPSGAGPEAPKCAPNKSLNPPFKGCPPVRRWCMSFFVKEKCQSCIGKQGGRDLGKAQYVPFAFGLVCSFCSNPGNDLGDEVMDWPEPDLGNACASLQSRRNSLRVSRRNARRLRRSLLRSRARTDFEGSSCDASSSSVGTGKPPPVVPARALGAPRGVTRAVVP